MCPLGFSPGGGHDVGYVYIQAPGARPESGHDVHLQALDLEAGMTWGMCLYRL